MTAEDGYEDLLDEWYETEHIPELLACPGFLSVRRYVVESGEKTSPQYLATWQLSGMEAFRSKEYLALQSRGLDDLSQLARESFLHRSRDLWAQYREIESISREPLG
jgi:hypothetical protein